MGRGRRGVRSARPWSRVSALVLLACLAWLRPASGQSESEKVHLHGFGSWIYGRTNANEYMNGLPGGNYTDVRLALNVMARVGEHLRISAQAEVLSDESETETEIDFAFAEWTFSDALKLRVGRGKQPFGIYTEVFDVGTLRPFSNLPQGVYGPVGLVGEAYEGVGITGTRLLGGGWGLAYDVYAGGMELEELAPPEQFLVGEPIEPGVDVEVERTKDLLGARVILETPVPGLTFGASAYTGREIGSNHRYVWGVHLDYSSDRWWIRSEYAHESVSRDLRVHGAYVEVARRLGAHWQVAAQYDRVSTSLAGIDPPEEAKSLLYHREVAAGVNYWFSSNFVLKLSCHLVHGNRFAAPKAEDLAATVTSGALERRTRLLQFGGQFTF